MRSYVAEGLILKRINLGEADKLYTVFTKNQGKIKVLAKGVRRIHSRRAGHLDQFNWVRIHLHEGKGPSAISEAETVRSFADLKKNFDRVIYAYECIELVDKLTAEGAANQAVFSLLTQILEELSRSDSPPPGELVSHFAASLFVALGFWDEGKPFLGDWRQFAENLAEKSLNSPKLLTKIGKNLK